MVETTRLRLLPLSETQLRLWLADTYTLDESLGLRRGRREFTPILRDIIEYFVLPDLEENPNTALFHTLWVAIDRTQQQLVAEAKFKGPPDELGFVEIGYGTYPSCRRQGYMTEMVNGMVEWVMQQPGVGGVRADTLPQNVASQRVLDRCGFRLTSQQEEVLWWEFTPVCS